MHAEPCPTCLKPQHLCVCEAVEPIDNQIFLLILQHPQEKRETLGTAQIAHLQFKNSALKVGLSWSNLKRILGREVDYKRWGVLYLGPVKQGDNAPKAEVAVVDKGGNVQKDSDLVLGDLEGVIVLDGTWSQAKTLWWRNPWLLKCRRIVLHPQFRSLYGQARKEPRRESVSTLEAGAFLLSRLEADPTVLDRALKPFSLLLKKLRAPRPRPVLPKAAPAEAEVQADAPATPEDHG
ncbi:tRNA-uridine aminocarboxypropyltransferase [Azospirillum soli]|uniref:tRNA-uridine aminocarboxypropyltransferase n=1 Tax=Azospirillum soli TaxID=1304799 RepID=UPI001AE1E45E|nr:tRNA-uridine aminocarboxypropyltransferase [Azospirillum soli]MBP2315112.1 DTW domain-containing protein YfiP [Azospirillum soli]